MECFMFLIHSDTAESSFYDILALWSAGTRYHKYHKRRDNSNFRKEKKIRENDICFYDFVQKYGKSGDTTKVTIILTA